MLSSGGGKLEVQPLQFASAMRCLPDPSLLGCRGARALPKRAHLISCSNNKRRASADARPASADDPAAPAVLEPPAPAEPAVRGARRAPGVAFPVVIRASAGMSPKPGVESLPRCGVFAQPFKEPGLTRTPTREASRSRAPL